MAHGDDPRTDQQLIAAINAGSEQAFEALYRRYRDWVVNLAYRFTHNRDDAIDVMQEVFIYVLRKFPGFELTAKFKTFLYPAVKHTAIALRDKRRRTADLDHTTAEQMIESSESHDDHGDLLALLNTLGQTHREVVILRFVDDLSMEEIAAALDIPPGTVKSRLHHATANMRADPKFRKFFQID